MTCVNIKTFKQHALSLKGTCASELPKVLAHQNLIHAILMQFQIFWRKKKVNIKVFIRVETQGGKNYINYTDFSSHLRVFS